MAFPLSPANNQTALVNGIVYQWNAALGVWKRNGSINSASIGQLVLTSTQSSTSNGSGTLIVAGGAGITGNLYTGGIYITGVNGITFPDGTSQTSAASPTDSYARTTANTATNNITVIQGVDTAQNTRMSIIEGVDTTQNSNITAADTKAQAAFDKANTAPKTTTSTTAPSSPTVGDMWYDTDYDVLLRYTYDGTANNWIDITGPIIRSTYIRPTYLITANVS